MSTSLIDNNTYYPSKNITIFPSSNAVDEGKLFTEFNGRNLTINITDMNYVVSPNPGGYDISLNNNQIDIQSGKAILNGFEINTDTVISYRLPTSDEIVNEGYYSGYALLCLHTLFDTLENLNGNVQVSKVVNEKVVTEWYCTGIRVEYVSYEDYNNNTNEYLLLGGVKTDGTIKQNKDKYSRIDAKYILVRLEGDEETNRPPTQTTDLLTFINNYLKGYWVSKAGDNEYGSLIFKPSEPVGYGEEGFDYKTEDPLTSTNFIVKICKSSTKGNIIVKQYKNLSTNYTSALSPDRLSFYQDIYRGDSSEISDASIRYKRNALDTTAFSTDNRLLDIRINPDYTGSTYGAVKLGVSPFDTATGKMEFCVENNKQSHDNVLIGRNIYAISTDDNHSHINYLSDDNGSIGSYHYVNNTLYGSFKLKTLNPHRIELYSKSDVSNSLAGITFRTDKTSATLELMEYNTSITNYLTQSTLGVSSNLHILNNLWANGYIAASNKPELITVPDYANNAGDRKLKAGDVFGSQVWSAVYNDIAEIFDVSDSISVGKEIIGLILAVDINNPTKHVLADRKNNCIVGVISENPAFCAGGQDCKQGVPVALVGRVKVKYEGKTPKIGDFVGLSKRKAGYSTKCNKFSKYIVGKVVKIIDESTVEILVIN